MRFHNQDERMAPSHFRNVSWLMLAFVVLSTLAHGLSLLLPPEPIAQLAERRFGATIISTVLAPAKFQPAPAQKAASLSQPKVPINELPQLTPTAKTTKQSTSPTNSTIGKTEFKIHLAKNSETTSEERIETLHPHRSSETSQKIKSATTTTASVNNLTSLTTEQLANQLDKQRNYLLGELHSRLNRYLTYPVRARRRGWQGEVLIAFDVNRGGELNNVRLAKTSGYSVLDRSAVNAINKLEKIFLPDTLGRLQAMELNLPVRYQLHDG